LNLKCVVETVDQIGQADHHDQLHDLGIGIVVAQPSENRRIDGRRPAGDEIGETDGGTLLLVICIAGLVKAEVFDLLVIDARLLRRSNVGAQSISTCIDAGGFEVGQLLELDGHLALRHNGCVKWHEPFQSRREMSHDGKNVGHFADGRMHSVVNGLYSGFGLVLDQRLRHPHGSHPFEENGQSVEYALYHERCSRGSREFHFRAGSPAAAAHGPRPERQPIETGSGF
jgi:hypothetical protein